MYVITAIHNETVICENNLSFTKVIIIFWIVCHITITSTYLAALSALQLYLLQIIIYFNTFINGVNENASLFVQQEEIYRGRAEAKRILDWRLSN